MKLARDVKQERRREVWLVFGIKFGDQARRRGEAQLRPPIAHVNNRQAHRIILPRIIQIEMQWDGGKMHDETANYADNADLSRNPDSVCRKIAEARRGWSPPKLRAFL